MTIQTVNTPPDDTSVTTFNTWGSAISSALASAGLTKTTDTGQVNWTSNASMPTTYGTVYEVWKFNDSLQSTAPVYFRLDYFNQTAYSTPQIAITIGTGSNGSGTINNQQLTDLTIFPYNVGWGSTVNQTLWVDSDGGSSMMIAGWFTATTGSGTVTVLERTRNWDGTVNGNGFGFYSVNIGNSSSATYQSILTSMAFSFLAGSNNATYYTAHTDLTQNFTMSRYGNGVYYPQPFPGPLTPMQGAPSVHAVIAAGHELPPGTQFSASLYGTSHTFIQPFWPSGNTYPTICPRIA